MLDVDTIKANKIISAAIEATESDLNNLSNDRVEAMTGGHGTLNIVELCICNALVDEVLSRGDISISNANARKIPLDDVLKKCIEVGIKGGASPANSAMLSAVSLYFSGVTGARAGCPAGNRKLGSMARLIAKVERCGVSNLPTGKQGNKVSGFPAVQAIYDIILKGELTQVISEKLPFALVGTTYVHSILGEEYLFKEVIYNATKAGTEAMIKVMNNGGAMMYKGMAAHLMAALMGTAAALEIIHPDANVKDDTGKYINTCTYAGRVAVEVAKLQPKIHMKLTGEEFDMGEIIGDIGLILKDMGGVSVIGMMAMVDIFSCFEEWLVWPGGPPLTPLSYLGGDQMVATRHLIKNGGDYQKTADLMVDYRNNKIDPEMSKLSLNIIARKAEEVHRGLVSKSLIYATDGARAHNLFNIANRTYFNLYHKKTLGEVVIMLEQEWREKIERNVSQFLSESEGKEITTKLTKLNNLGRLFPAKRDKTTLWAIDVNADVLVTVDGKETHLEGIAHKIIPKVVLEGCEKEYSDCVGFALFLLTNLSYGSAVISEIVLTTALGVLMRDLEPKTAVNEVLKHAYLRTGIPGAKNKAIEVAINAQRILKEMNKYEIELGHPN